jgi:hypothetical protein
LLAGLVWNTGDLARFGAAAQPDTRESAESFALAVASPASGSISLSRITVLVYNYAGISREAVAETERVAGTVLGHAGIYSDWLDCPLYPDRAADHPACLVTPGPARLILRIAAGSMTQRMQPDQESFGFALQPEDGSFGAVANVFADRARELVNRRRMAFGVMLGYLTAHELGHLLLGAGAHSSAGIMHVPWGSKELDMLSRGLMAFMPAEAERMRISIRARLAAQHALEEAIVPGS